MKETGKTIAVIMLHAGCTMRCMFCITDNTVNCMTQQQYTELLDSLRRQGFNNVVLGGGEPLCWPHGLHRAARLAKEQGMLVQVGTNGIAMSEERLGNDDVDRYVLPLDGATPSLHNYLRIMPKHGTGHHALILRRLEQLRLRGCSATVSTVVSRLNMDNVVAIGDYLADYVAGGGRLHAWHLYRFIPDGRGGAVNARRLEISGDEYNEVVQSARSQFYPFTIFKRPQMRHSATVEFFWYEHGLLRMGSEHWKNEGNRVSEKRSAQALAADERL